MSSGISGEGVLRRLLEQMNSQAPARRVRLREVVSSVDPHYVGKDGREYAMSREELERIASALRRRGLYDLRLPIIVMADASHQQSVWRIEGEEECAVIAEVLGRSEPESPSRMFLYGPHMAVLRRELPTTTVCLYIP